VIHAAILREHLTLAPNDIDPLIPLLSGPLPERKGQSEREWTMSSVRLKQEELLGDGTRGAKASYRYVRSS